MRLGADDADAIARRLRRATSSSGSTSSSPRPSSSTRSATSSACTRSPSRTRNEFGQRPKLDDYARPRAARLLRRRRRRRRRARPDRGPPLRQRRLASSPSAATAVHARSSAERARATTADDRGGRRLPRPRRADRLVLRPSCEALDDEIERSRTRSLDRRRTSDQRERVLSAAPRSVGPLTRVCRRSATSSLASATSSTALPGLERDDARLLPRRLRPPAPHRRAARRASASALPARCDLYSSMRRQPPQRDHRAAHARRHVFLPLTFRDGLLRQNFGWLVRHIDTPGRVPGPRHRRSRDRRRCAGPVRAASGERRGYSGL